MLKAHLNFRSVSCSDQDFLYIRFIRTARVDVLVYNCSSCKPDEHIHRIVILLIGLNDPLLQSVLSFNSNRYCCDDKMVFAPAGGANLWSAFSNLVVSL